MESKASNSEKNKEAQALLIKKLEQLGADHIKPVNSRRKFIECNINGKKKTIFYNSKANGDWQPSLNHAEDCDPFEENDKLWILIDLQKNKFFVIPERWLAKNIHDTHEAYKQRHGGKRPINNDSGHHKTSEKEVKQWEEAWDIIFDDKIDSAYNDEVQKEEQYIEGSVTTVKVNAYERNQAARRECLNLFGHSCMVCGFDFNKVYGSIGEGFIHVHHKIELSSIGQSYSIDPKSDLVPVCPNCHAMLHKRKPAYSIDELKKIIEESK